MIAHRYRQALILGALIVFLVWTYMLVHAVRMEERGVAPRGFAIDNAGKVVQLHERVWELGRGYRQATEEEKDFEGGR